MSTTRGQSWLSIHVDDLAGATAELDEFEAGCVAGVVEYTWDQSNNYCGGAEEEAEATKTREENATMQANFNNDIPRLVQVTEGRIRI